MKKNFGQGILDARKLLETSPQDYLDAMQTSMFGAAAMLDAMQEEKSPTLLEKELIYLLLNNDVENEEELNIFIDQNGSETAKSSFEEIRASTTSNLATMPDAFIDGFGEININDLKSVYLESLIQNW
jgi:hypothetical protein